MSDRIESTFAALKASGKKGLIPFIMAGDPNMQECERLLMGLPAAGADLIEIGMPFSDPMADGPTIQAAGLRALKAGTKLRDVLSLVKRFRAKHATPIILMGYYNPVYHYGLEAFCKDATAAGADGIILVDLPPEEEDEFLAAANPHGLKLIRLIAPTTDDARLARLSAHAGGFLYYLAVAGVTGTTSADSALLAKRAEHLASRIALPLAIGFGIRTPQQAAETAKNCDAVVVGSALVETIAQNGVEAGLGFVRALSAAIDEIQ
jgi:tryptophan synthase alpha chain